MTIISELENKEFKSFLDAFNTVYHNPPQSKDDKAEQEVWEALEKFQQLFNAEVEALVNNPDSASTIVPPFIKFARENPLILYYCKKTFIKFHGFAVDKKDHAPLTLEDLTPKKLFSTVASGHCNTSAFNVSCAFVVFPELKTDPSLLFELVNFDQFKEAYLYYQKDKVVISPAMINDLMLCLVKNLKIDKENPGLGKKYVTQNLHFLLSSGLCLPSEREGEEWFRYFPWEDMRDHQIFLFDHMEKEKAEILQYLNEHNPKLVYHHLLRGHFFIAEQLMTLGLKAPEFDSLSFLIESVQVGLKASIEMKKYHAMLLALTHLGFVASKEVVRLSNLLDKTQSADIQKLVDDNIPKLVKHYVETHDDRLLVGKGVVRKEYYKALNFIMLAIERDYGIALSTIYNHPIMESFDEIRCYRGVTILKTPLNVQLAEHWLQYGHRASFYSFLGHGYNTGVYSDVEEGPSMPWAGGSNTTRISPVPSLGYVRTEDYCDAFLLCLCYRFGQPIFFGNIPPATDKLPNELEVPYMPPESLESVYYLEYDSVKRVYLQSNIAMKPAIVQVGENFSLPTPERQHLMEQNKEQFLRTLQPLRPQFDVTYAKYIETYRTEQLVSEFNKHYYGLGSIADRMGHIERQLSQMGAFSETDIVPTILEYIGNEDEQECKAIDEQVAVALRGIEAVPAATHAMIGIKLKLGQSNGQQIIDLISQHYPSIKHLYHSGAQVWEGYTVGVHTGLVFEKLEKHQSLPEYRATMQSISAVIPNVGALFPLCIALHDIGKAIGFKRDQHKYTMLIIEKLFSVWKFSKQEILFAKMLVNHDLLGNFFRRASDMDALQQQTALDKLVSTLQDNCGKMKGLKFKDYFYLQSVFYLSDTASYPNLYKAIMMQVPSLPFDHILTDPLFRTLASRCQWHLPLEAFPQEATVPSSTASAKPESLLVQFNAVTVENEKEFMAYKTMSSEEKEQFNKLAQIAAQTKDCTELNAFLDKVKCKKDSSDDDLRRDVYYV